MIPGVSRLVYTFTDSVEKDVKTSLLIKCRWTLLRCSVGILRHEGPLLER